MERQIIFNTEMVQAILEGRKTQTRRVVKPSNTVGFLYPKKLLDFFSVFGNNPFGVKVKSKYSDTTWRGRCKWEIGDRLWVQETWQVTHWMHPTDENYGYIYKASENGRDWEENSEGWTWRPSIHMPQEAARIWLRVKDVRVERVQDISETDLIREGIPNGDYAINPKASTEAMVQALVSDQKYSWFRRLWDSIYEKQGHGWEANPWVWVVEFEVINTDGRPTSLFWLH